MKILEFLRLSVSSNSGISSKRLMGSICIMAGILIPFTAMLMEPRGEIHDSVLVLVAQLLTSGCGLLGLTLGERLFVRRKCNCEYKEEILNEEDTDEVIKTKE